MLLLLRVLAPCALVALSACMNVSPPGTSFATEPPGARVLVDGRDTGWVTPCMIDLGDDEDVVVGFQLEGHVPRELLLVPLERHRVVEWYTGVNGVRSTIRSPILMPLTDLVLPFREIRSLAPGRVFVRLRPADGVAPVELASSPPPVAPPAIGP